jgi:hypothetical protein
VLPCFGYHLFEILLSYRFDHFSHHFFRLGGVRGKNSDGNPALSGDYGSCTAAAGAVDGVSPGAHGDLL